MVLKQIQFSNSVIKIENEVNLTSVQLENKYMKCFTFIGQIYEVINLQLANILTYEYRMRIKCSVTLT